MASPFEIIGLVETVISVTSKIYPFFKSVHDAPQEVEAFLLELDSLRKIFPNIGVSASRLQIAISAPRKNMGPDVYLLRTEKPLLWHDLLKKIGKSVSWVLSIEEIEKSTRRLDRMKQNLQLAMLACGIDNDVTIMEVLSNVRDSVEENSMLIESRAQDLERILLAGMRQFEFLAFTRVNDLQSIAAIQQVDNQRRLTDLSNSVPAGFMRLQGTINTGTGSDSRIREEVVTASSRETSLAIPGTGSTAEAYHSRNRNGNGFNGEVSEETLRQTLELLEMTVQSDRNATPITVSDIEQQLLKLESKRDEKRRFKSSRISSLTQKMIPSLEVFDSLLNTTLPGGSKYPSVVYASLRMILQHSWTVPKDLDNTLEAISEMQDAAVACQREYELYPVAKVRELNVTLYKEMFSFLQHTLNLVKEPKYKSVMRAAEDRHEIDDRIGRARKISQKIIREVEYLHRKELKEAHIRLQEIERKQDRVLQIMEAQEKILILLQEEQKIMTVISDQQKILQMLQQLQMKFPLAP